MIVPGCEQDASSLDCEQIFFGKVTCRVPWRSDLQSVEDMRSDLIFVTNLTNQVGGEKNCHVEKCQLSMRDDCGKI